MASDITIEHDDETYIASPSPERDCEGCAFEGVECGRVPCTPGVTVDGKLLGQHVIWIKQ